MNFNFFQFFQFFQNGSRNPKKLDLCGRKGLENSIFSIFSIFSDSSEDLKISGSLDLGSRILGSRVSDVGSPGSRVSEMSVLFSWNPRISGLGPRMLGFPDVGYREPKFVMGPFCVII